MKERTVKRTKYLKIRLTPMEKRILEKKADHSGLQVAPYCRACALDKKINYKLTEEELSAYQMLVKYHNNFKAIGNLLMNKETAFAKEVAAVAREIKEHLQKFR